MRKQLIIFSIFFLFTACGCEDTDIRLAAEAGIEAVTAITLSNEAVAQLAETTAAYLDATHMAAPAGNPYARRLDRLVGEHLVEDGIEFNYRVYLDDTVNAFAMADGTIRIYKGLMDMLDDGELRFVIGHEMGHVVKNHVRRKMQIAYAASAVRKGIASQNNVLGDLARTQIGAFTELVLGAQFSQYEEKIADDYGLNFLRKEEYPHTGSVSALRKLASLGAQHSFLSSHPDPEQRAERLQQILQGNAVPLEQAQKNYTDKVRALLLKSYSLVQAAWQSFSAVLETS